ncbi:MAG: hypothetical protein ACE15D_07990 [Candidatus Eisenbacteria bacterium]
MRIQPGALRLPPLLALGPLLLALAASPAISSTLTLQPLLESDTDLLRVAPQEDGTAVVLREREVGLASQGPFVVRASAGAQQTLTIADEGGWIGIADHRPGAADFAPVASFTLLAPDGRTAWSLGETEDVAFLISGQGRVAGLQLNINVPDRNRLRFYGDGGEVVADLPLPYLEGASFDPSGRRLFALSSLDGLHAFTVDGEELWSLPGARMFAPSAGGDLVAAIAGDALVVVRDGRPDAPIPLDGLLVRRVAVAPDGGRLAIADKHEIRVFSVGARIPEWNVDLTSERLAVTSLDLADGRGWLLAGLARDLGEQVPILERHPSGEVRAYDADGRLEHSATMPFPIWNIWTPTARIDRSGHAATITTRRSVYRVALP